MYTKCTVSHPTESKSSVYNHSVRTLTDSMMMSTDRYLKTWTMVMIWNLSVIQMTRSNTIHQNDVKQNMKVWRSFWGQNVIDTKVIGRMMTCNNAEMNTKFTNQCDHYWTRESAVYIVFYHCFSNWHIFHIQQKSHQVVNAFSQRGCFHPL